MGFLLLLKGAFAINYACLWSIYMSTLQYKKYCVLLANFSIFLDNRLIQFVDSYDPPLKGLQEDLNFVSPRIGEVLRLIYFITNIITQVDYFSFHIFSSTPFLPST